MVRLTDPPDMTLDVYRGRKTTMQQQQPSKGEAVYTKKIPDKFCRYNYVLEHRIQRRIAHAFCLCYSCNTIMMFMSVVKANSRFEGVVMLGNSENISQPFI